jgi:AcrR family transcriptional regulator
VSVVLDDRVLDAVARLLDREGLAGLSLSAIATEANLSRVTLHRRGATVDDYVVAVLGRASDELRDALWPVLTGSGSAAERLQVALRSLCEVADRHRGVMTAFYAQPARPLPEDPDRTTSFRFIEPFERLVRDGVVDGSLHSDDPRADATLVANAVCWTYLHMRQAHGWAPGPTAERAVAMGMGLLRVDVSPG